MSAEYCAKVTYIAHSQDSDPLRICVHTALLRHYLFEKVMFFVVFNSVVKEQQASSHYHPEPSYPSDRRGGRLYRLHSYHAVPGHERNAMHCPVRGDANLAS